MENKKELFTEITMDTSQSKIMNIFSEIIQTTEKKKESIMVTTINSASKAPMLLEIMATTEMETRSLMEMATTSTLKVHTHSEATPTTETETR